MKLINMLKEGDKVKLQQLLPELALTKVNIEVVHMDGAGNKGGSVKNTVWTAANTLKLDQSDVRVLDGKLDLSHPATKEITVHELIHIMQGQRGFFYRLKMWFWNLTKSYAKRPHEIEAYQVSRRLMHNL